MARTSWGFPFSANADVRDATRSPATRVSASMSSSVMPSLRYSFSGSGLALTNGRTAMPRVAGRAATVAGPLSVSVSARANSETLS